MNTENFKQSRIGKAPVAIPSGVDVKINGRTVSLKGPKGSIERTFHPSVEIKQADGHLTVELHQLDNEGRAISGLCRSLLHNMVVGVSQGYERKLEINGTGYRAELRGKNEILFNLGYSHPIVYELPDCVQAEISKDNKITLRSADKEEIGKTAAKIRSFRKPEPYKGKGIKYAEEVIQRKAGKTSGK
ncbi:MAG: 50S ribosomal protein L6 [Proteobacteria bacterium]|jgi:large subunit ribosomal protein L6|nr:50S ribosomal protein L6 [Pseudomonadota bacterium]